MDSTDIKNLIKTYEIENKLNGWMDREAYFQEFIKTHNRLLLDVPLEPKITALIMYIRISHNPINLGIYEAFKCFDMQLLNNVLYQAACIEQVGNISSSGVDHSCFSFHIIPEILASNCVSRIPFIIPESFGMSKNGHRVAKAKMNLIMALWYNCQDFTTEAREDAEQTLKTKLTISHSASISYLLALLNKQPTIASQQLDMFCCGMKASKEFGATKFSKSFCIEAHGLFNLAYYIHDGELAGKIEMPNQSNFSKELAQWQKININQQGKLYLEYPFPLEIVNIILSITPPENSLYQPYLQEKGRQDWCINAESFKKEVIQSVIAAYSK